MAKILIVEDNEYNRKLFVDIITLHDHEVAVTGDGFAVLDMVIDWQPDLILMDIQLPQISGLEVTTNLKNHPSTAHIPVIAVTAFAMKGDEKKIRQGGCDGYVAKPISVQGLVDAINKILVKS